jgi:hypothetical protein
MSTSVIDSKIESATAQGPPGLTEFTVPGGLWLRSGTDRPAEPLLPGFCTDPKDGQFALLIGRPGEPLPRLADVADVARGLVAPLRERMAVTVYGPEPASDRCVAQRLADLLGSPVRAHHGVLLKTADGVMNRYAVGPDGVPTWQPFAQLSTYAPGGTGPVGKLWRAHLPSAVKLGPGRYRLTVDWTVDVVPAGLVVRPAEVPPRPVLSCAPTDPDRVDLIIDAPDERGLTDDMLTALSRFADGLPSAARARARLVLMPGLPALSERALRWAVPAPTKIWVDPTPVPDVTPVPAPDPVPVLEVVPVPARDPVPGPEPDRLEPLPATEVAPELEPVLTQEVAPELEPLVEPLTLEQLDPLRAARPVTSLVVGRSGRMFLI